MGVNTQLTVLEVQSGWFPLQMREDFVLLFRNTYFYFNSPSHHSWIFQDLWDQARVSTCLNTGARKDGAKTKVISFFLKMESWGFSSRGPGFNCSTRMALTTIWNPDPRKSDALFWPLSSPGMRRNTCRQHLHTLNIKDSVSLWDTCWPLIHWEILLP